VVTDHDVPVVGGVADSEDRSALAGAVATVAIACFGGPVAGGTAALGELVKLAQARYRKDASARELHRQVTAAVKGWACSEGLRPESDLGLALAASIIAAHGADTKVIAALDFDPHAVSRRVIAAAKADDRFWGLEDHYAVAERVIAETYGVLVRQLQEGAPVLIPTVQAMRSALDSRLADLTEEARTMQATLDGLARVLVASGTTAEVMAYLAARIEDWDISVWHPGRQFPSMLERRVRVRRVGPGSSRGASPEVLVTAEEALAGQRMLVVLGGPGAGKTWLARQYARQAAQAALSRLEDGAELDEVELPLLTTWDQWTRITGAPDSQGALIVASFASGLGHRSVGDPDTVARLQRTFAQRGRQVLLVVDSLDEAAGRAGQATRLRELIALKGWRVVITSRPAGWEATSRSTSAAGDGPCVVEVQDLQYPDDVEAFIRAWFAVDDRRGDALVRQVRARADLSRVAVIPLLLTFYCLLTEDTPDPDRPLPVRRRELYRRLVRRLLRSGWSDTAPGPDTAPDLDACETRLRSWAWHAVKDRVTPTGLGDWEDTFTQPSRPEPNEARALDHVAPKVLENAEGYVTRRFVHRTILEHMVAEYIATLPATEAAEVLLPHLWFDPDWQVAAPAAIAAHNSVHNHSQQHDEDVLQLVLSQARPAATDPARELAFHEIDRLLLAIADESKPDDWPEPVQKLIHETRATNAARELTAVASSAHWTQSNENACAGVLAVLASSVAESPWEVRRLVDGLIALQPRDAEREQARAAVLAALPPLPGVIAGGMVDGLIALAVSDAEREHAFAGVLAALLSPNDPGCWGGLVDGLIALVGSDADRERARAGVLAVLASSAAESPWEVRRLVDGLIALVGSDAEREQARAAVLAALSAAEPGAVGGLVECLIALVASDADRERARAAVLAALPTANLWVVEGLVKWLIALQPSDAERKQARAGFLAALPTVHPRAVWALAAGLIVLQPSDAERKQARAAVVAALSTVDPGGVWVLVECLVALQPSDAERKQARAAVLASAAAMSPWQVERLVECLVALQPSDAEREQAREGVLAVLAALSAADHYAVGELVECLVALQPSDAEREQAREGVLAVLAALDDADPRVVGGLIALVVNDAEREQVRAGVLAVLPAVGPEAVGGLVECLIALQPSDVDRKQARAAVLAALPAARPGDVGKLVGSLRSMSPIRQWLDWLMKEGGINPYSHPRTPRRRMG
jgi:hypothetical protein